VKTGDLVKRTPKWGDWVAQNPWMYTDEDHQIGMIIKVGALRLVEVVWPTGIKAERKDKLEVVSEGR